MRTRELIRRREMPEVTEVTVLFVTRGARPRVNRIFRFRLPGSHAAVNVGGQRPPEGLAVILGGGAPPGGTAIGPVLRAAAGGDRVVLRTKHAGQDGALIVTSAEPERVRNGSRSGGRREVRGNAGLRNTDGRKDTCERRNGAGRPRWRGR